MGFSFKMVSNQNLASLVWLKSEPSLEWLLPLWAEPKLQTRGCLKPGSRSRSDLRISFFPLKFHFVFSSAHPHPSFQTSKLQLNCITAFFLTFPQHDFFWWLTFSFPSLPDVWLFWHSPSSFSFSSFPDPSCASLFYIPSAHSKHCCYGHYHHIDHGIHHRHLEAFINYSHSTASNSHLTPLKMPWVSLFPYFSVFMLYWLCQLYTLTCSPAAKFYVTILEFCCRGHWEIFMSASALMFWTHIRADKHNISFHSSLKSM